MPLCVNLELHALINKSTSVAEDEPPYSCFSASRVASSADLSKEVFATGAVPAQVDRQGPTLSEDAPLDKGTPSTQEYSDNFVLAGFREPQRERIVAATTGKFSTCVATQLLAPMAARQLSSEGSSVVISADQP